MSEVKKFSRIHKTLSVDIDGESYTLKELSGTLRDRYLNTQSKKTITKNGVETRVYSGLCSDLLVLCLYNPAGVSVTAQEIDDWPSPMQMEIFQMAVKLSALDKKSEEEEVKN